MSTGLENLQFIIWSKGMRAVSEESRRRCVVVMNALPGLRPQKDVKACT